MQGFDSYDRLPSLRVPTLVLHGTEDRVIPVENGRRLAERIPGAEVVLLEGAGHVYHSERADEADAAVLDFVRRHADA
jgi:pimeloyl-ACP methyl ester carboxylesterase